MAEAGHVGVVVVHHGDASPTRRCVESVLADPSSVRRAVVVVDHSGNLDSGSLPDGVHRLNRPDNPGFGGGAASGVEALDRAADETLPVAYVVLNHDVELLAGYLEAAARAVATPGVGAAAGPLHREAADGPLWYAGGGVRWLTGTVRQSRSPDDASRERDVGFLPGAALAVSPTAWHRVGGFDPRIFLYHEDLDLCLRLRRAGWRLRFVPAMRAVHHVGAATGSADASPFYLEHMARTRLLPHRPAAYRLYLAVLHTGWVALRSARYLLRGGDGDGERARALWRGHRHALSTVLARR